MHLCGSRELQHIEFTRRYCDVALSDSQHAPEVIFDGSICPSDPWLNIPFALACVVFFKCLITLTVLYITLQTLHVAVSRCGVTFSKLFTFDISNIHCLAKEKVPPKKKGHTHTNYVGPRLALITAFVPCSIVLTSPWLH